jgi:hypothetical protein
MFLARALLTTSAAILFVLGTLHWVFTYWGPRFRPRDPALLARMQEVSPVISPQTTMWKVWVGYNGSHSLGILLFAVVYGYLALLHPAFLFQSKFLLAVGLCALAAYVALAKAYWFDVPFRGALLALAAYVAGLIVALAA